MPRSAKVDEKLLAFLGAFCLFLSTIEYMIPKPLPFMRLGISNLPIILALDLMPASQVLLLMAIKVVGQNLLAGTLFSYVVLFSAAGSFSSAFVMLAARRVFRERISLVGISILGAFVSNLAQISLARVFIFGESAWYIAPPFIGLGIVTGVLLGAFCEGFRDKSEWFKQMRQRELG